MGTRNADPETDGEKNTNTTNDYQGNAGDIINNKNGNEDEHEAKNKESDEDEKDNLHPPYFWALAGSWMAWTHTCDMTLDWLSTKSVWVPTV